MQHHTDFNDILTPLASRGQQVIRTDLKEDPEAQSRQIPGRYFDPVSGRLDNISEGEYFRHPVETWHYGRADFIYHGQKEGHYAIPIVNLYEKKEKKSIPKKYQTNAVASSGWMELKIWEPTVIKKDSCYTNLPAQY